MSSLQPAATASTPEASPAASAASARLLTGFSFLWALSALYHQVQEYKTLEKALGFAGEHQYFTLACVLLLVRPASRFWLVHYVVAEVALIWTQQPNIRNHWFLHFAVAVTLLAGLARTMVQQRRLRFDRALFYDTVAPLLRIECLVLYFFVVFHKLNWDYLNLDLSCGPSHYMQWKRDYLSWLPTGEWMMQATIYGSLLLETAIPVLLMMRRWRVAGATLGIIYHFGLAYSGHLAFTTTMYALYLPFLGFDPGRPRARSATRGERWSETAQMWLRDHVPALRRLEDALLRADPALLAAGVFFFLLASLATPRSAYWVLPLVAVLLLAGLAYLHGRGSRDERGAIAQLVARAPWLWIFPAALFFVGLNPYLGLRTQGTFSMFSNLRTEGGASNHLLIPIELQVARYLRDLVTVRDAAEPLQRRGLKPGRTITRFELRQAVSTAAARGAKDLSLSYADVATGAITAIERAEAAPQLSEPYSYLELKYFKFRTIPWRRPNRCLH